ncbi:MAG: DUF3261 domain-containing protein [Elusimicrobia bacterium]|nr:DUF3261 domain-containing protein [Elusimicrobiota bacterium]
MKGNNAFVLLGLALLLPGCDATARRRLDPGLFLLAPSEAGFEASMTQEVSFERGTTRFDSTALVEVSTTEVVLVGLSPFGTRMLSLRWDGEKLIEERDRSIPKGLALKLILRDVQLASWPAAAVQAALPGPAWNLQDTGSERTLLKDGEAVVRIRYGGADRLHSDLEFEHLGLGYRMKIHTLQESEEGE